MRVVVLVADGARADAFTGDLSALPALQRLRDEGGHHVITSVFPSVTGPAYTPFLMGRFPGEIGVPGLRWYDRSRTDAIWPDRSRSYVGPQMRRFDSDLDAAAPTVFELVPRSVGALSVITRGLPPERRVGALTVASAARAAATHFRGRVDAWLDVDRQVAAELARRVRVESPDYLFAALTGIDKASHSQGHDSPLVRRAVVIVDETVAMLRETLERDGTWDETHLWIVSDHGHSPVRSHEDLADWVASRGLRTIAHPWPVALAPDVAVMVSGNAMAHLYLELASPVRPGWNQLRTRHGAFADALLARESVDVMLLPVDADACLVRHTTRGDALITHQGNCYRYERHSGDPLGLGADFEGDANDAYDATIDTEYPDAVVQIASLCRSSRVGDIILSATPGWDFRARWEPIPHRSAHGALHRDHMLVPLLTNRPPARAPRRTTDVFASTLDALGVTSPAHLDGESWL